MKLKFFIIIFASLLVTVGAVTALHFRFFRSERLRLVDNQIQGSASLLLTSDLSRVPLHDIEEAEDFFSNLLGTESLNKLILLRDVDGSVLYSSRNAQWLPEEVSADEPWRTLVVGGHTIRLLTVKVPTIHRVLQVGMVLDTQLLRWQQIDDIFLYYVVGIIALVLLVSLVIVHLLLKPLRNLAAYLDYLSNNEISSKKIQIPWARTRARDEFDNLALSVQRLTEKIGLNLETFRAWGAQLAHEMKTPLTIIRNCVETAAIKKDVETPLLREAISELDRLDGTINGFLEWAAVENSSDAQKDIRALSLLRIVQDSVSRLARLHPDRLSLLVHEDAQVFANPQYVEQLVTNLLSNALKYSPDGARVEVILDKESLAIRDHGAGVPAVVMKKLGEPFNVFRQRGRTGTGLGLAWVKTICKKYGWQFQLEPSDVGTLARVAFT